MNRRKFIQYSVLGGGSLLVGLNLHNPDRAEAFFPIFFTLMGAMGLSSSVSGGYPQSWLNSRLEAQLGQRELVRRYFTNIVVAEANLPQYNYILAGQFQKNVPNNEGFVFPRIDNDYSSVTGFSGPASLGMAAAAKYLKEQQRMDYNQVQSAILPSYRGGINHDGWRDWTSSSSGGYSNSYADGGVRISYDLRGNSGIIDVSVRADRWVKVPPIVVNL